MNEWDPTQFGPSEDQAAKANRVYLELLRSARSLLEIGPGRGAFMEAAEAAGIDMVGLELDDELARQARDRNLNVITGDAREVGQYFSRDFDGVFASHVIEHLDSTAVLEFFRQCAEITQPGALMLLVTPNMKDLRVATHLFWSDPTHVRPYPEEAVRALIAMGNLDWRMEEAGYEPRAMSREYILDIMRRPFLGRDYGLGGRWYLLKRVTTSNGCRN